MALIGCPECGREVSSSAAACPACAYPVVSGTPAVPHPAVKSGPRYEWVIPAISIFGRVGVGIMLWVAGVDEGSIAAQMGGLIVGGSAIPTFVRAWKARPKPARLDGAQPGPGLTADLEDRVLDMERLHQEQIADLEERLDFAERLLAKQREQIGPG